MYLQRSPRADAYSRAMRSLLPFLGVYLIALILGGSSSAASEPATASEVDARTCYYACDTWTLYPTLEACTEVCPEPCSRRCW